MNITSQHSFVVPAYKDSVYLEPCLLSLKAQNVQSKIIVCASARSKFVEELCSRLEIEFRPNSEAGGIGRDWNFALLQSDTAFTTIAHQDDLYHPDYSKSIIEQINYWGTEYISLIFTASQNIDDNGHMISGNNDRIKNILLLPFHLRRFHSSSFMKSFILKFGNPISCPTVSLNTSKLSKFRFSTSLRYTVDWNAWIEISRSKGGFVYLPEKLVSHRIHQDSATTAEMNNGNRIAEEELILQHTLGKTLGKIWSRLYALGHKENKF